MGDPVGVYRLIPGWFLRCRLQRRYLWIFWYDVAASDSVKELKEIVSECAGELK